ncbi:MAG: type I-E CRISPR-associated endoribonuclease Cas2e [Sphaerochaetaceae bacterium]|jgi:CRISPR-associated protein Cas2|nr:type I-E CRISPR-associated endoribonuclease Cas2e [Candidatus Cloacimonadota bacterium]
MVVVLSDFIPPAVRGRMKLWFVEPRPNVFVSGIKDSVADSVVEYLFSHCPSNSGLLVFQRTNEPPFYRIRGFGDSRNKIASFEGLQLIFEKIAKE